MHPIEIYYFLDINRLKAAICVRDYGFQILSFETQKYGEYESTNQTKSIVLVRKIGIDNIFSEASCNKKGLFNSAGREMTRITSDHMMYRALLTEKTKRIH